MANETFGKLVKKMREDRDLSMQDLADILEVSKSSINMWENAGVVPREPVLKRVSSMFNVSIDYLLGNITKEQELQNKYDERTVDLAIQDFLGGLDDEDFDKMITVMKLLFSGKDEHELDGVEDYLRRLHAKYREARKYNAVIGLEYSEEQDIEMWRRYQKFMREEKMEERKEERRRKKEEKNK